jgi:DNA-binding CsgD family transcriptional regulator
LALVGEAAATQRKQPFELSVIELLRELIPADRAGYYESDIRGRGNTYFVDQPSKAVDIDWQSDTVNAVIWSWPLFELRFDRFPEVALKLSDFLTKTKLRRNPWYCEIQRAGGVEHEIKLWLPAPTGTVRGFFLLRTARSPDFNERDRALLTVLRPHLAAIRERWDQRRHPAGLTDRETEVLALVAEGLTNKEIAGRLTISGTTVRSHLEHIFEKLDVHTRTAAVARLTGVDTRG